MAKITFILGGARGGKSTAALKMAKKYGDEVAFVATATVFDKEMKARIALHKKNRPSVWATYEEPKNVVPILRKINSKVKLVIIDCLTLLISNMLLDGMKDLEIENRVIQMLETLRSAKYKSVIVSNEVGLGLHPNNALGRRFRDLQGRVNQMVAGKADQVLFMVSGIPMKVKGN